MGPATRLRARPTGRRCARPRRRSWCRFPGGVRRVAGCRSGGADRNRGPQRGRGNHAGQRASRPRSHPPSDGRPTGRCRGATTCSPISQRTGFTANTTEYRRVGGHPTTWPHNWGAARPGGDVRAALAGRATCRADSDHPRRRWAGLVATGGGAADPRGHPDPDCGITPEISRCGQRLSRCGFNQLHPALR